MECVRAGKERVGNCRREGWGGGSVHEGREVECVRTEKERVGNCRKEGWRWDEGS